MLELIAKGYNNKNPVYLWHVGNYEYEIETKAPLGNSSMLLLDTAYEDALARFEKIVDRTEFGVLTEKDFS